METKARENLFLKKQEGQFDTLILILAKLKHYFSPVFLPALKKADGKILEAEELKRMEAFPDANELVERFKGLIKRFGSMFNQALVQINEEYSVTIERESLEQESLKKEEVYEEFETAQSSQRKKIPKGYTLWDLKKVKLHESDTERNKKIWVGFWTLRGHHGIGEFVTNERKKILYFRPHPTSNVEIFPLVLDDGRILSRQGKTYYFKIVDEPAMLP